MKRIVLESPYAGDIAANVRYARECMRDSILRGEAPIASHLLYTQDGVLDDSVFSDRKLGIEMGYRWGMLADAVVFYTDLGMSPGMESALEYYDSLKITTIMRSIR